MKPLEKFNNKYHVQIELTVQWGDMDAFNHVNNVMYFRYFESARIAYFEKLGVMGKGSKDNVAPILAETNCRYKLPLNYPDTITVGTRVIEKHSHGFLMEYAIYSHHYKKTTSIGTGRIVMLNYSSHEKVAVDEQLLNKINSIEDAIN
ncbi:MAG: acyl-CoA thioesterase [Alcanivoracaceae bacterium]|nr:acyl-CoA thioesterase [Alcanivoracaceae bacterium]